MSKVLKTNLKTGLNTKEVQQRISNNLVNYDTLPKTKTIKQIIKSNFFTYFNMLNIALGACVFFVGLFNNALYEGIKNCLFMGVIFTNSVISIVEEIISKKIIDKLNVLTEEKVNVLRNSQYEELEINELVLDDIVELKSGHQIVCDSIVRSGVVEVNESLITGESDAITKKVGDTLLSGSFIVSGSCLAQIIHVAEDNYVSVISKSAKYVKKTPSLIMSSFEKILKIISFLIIPLGVMLFLTQMKVTDGEITSSVFTSTAGVIGMIPEGLILLTTSVMAVSVIRLSKYKVLVQGLSAVETLARTDVICLDKTGTLTEGKMTLKKVIPYKDLKKKDIEEILTAICYNMNDKNATMEAIKEKYNKESSWKLKEEIPFSSSRKFSCLSFDKKGAFYLGAGDILFKNNKEIIKIIEKYQKKYRVIVLAKSKTCDFTPKNLKPLAFIMIEDIIRPSAESTLKYFKKQGIEVKIISGDNLSTVTRISEICGLKNINGLDTSTVKEDELISIAENYNVFARVTPTGKKLIIKSLQDKGYTVGMTGDGVNDVLALKQSDCSIALGNGADATRSVSSIILLDGNFDSLPKIINEGRRTINNIERSASLLLMKTIYTILLILFSIISKSEYFFVPIQLTLITGVTIGIPSFILALEPNHELVSGNFLIKILNKSIPVALTVVINVMIVTLFGNCLNFSSEITSTMSVILTTLTGFIFLIKLCNPYNILRISLITFLMSLFLYACFFHANLFNISELSLHHLVVLTMLTLASIFVYVVLEELSNFIYDKYNEKNVNKRKQSKKVLTFQN